MKEILKNILKSFTSDTEGYSSRKLTAFIIIICVIAIHIKWLTLGDLTQLEMVLTIDYTFICTMFGINVADKKINNNPTPPTNTEQPLN